MKLKSNHNVIVVMAKHWRDEAVKTRLAASIGADRARKIYRSVAFDFWHNIESPLWSRHLWSSSKQSQRDLNTWLSGSECIAAQKGGDLGERMYHALTNTDFGNWIGISGTDAPDLDADYISKLCQSLCSNDICIAPTHDGGYAFMAMKSVHSVLFKDIEWSSSRVLKQTLVACESANLKVHLGPYLNDLDDINDLQLFRSRGYKWAQNDFNF